MRDISRRLGRYRLSRYAPPVDRVHRSLKWAWWLGALWMLWICVISDHSFLRIWQLSRKSAATQHQLASSRLELDRITAELSHPDFLAERTARRDLRMARPGERIYVESNERPAQPAP